MATTTRRREITVERERVILVRRAAAAPPAKEETTVKTQLLRLFARLRKMLMLSLLVTTAASAQNVTMGRIPASGNGYGPTNAGQPLTIIDLGHPALVAGTIASATVKWSSAPATPCASAFKIKVFRQQPNNPEFYGLVAERGPFPTTPPVPTTLNSGNTALITVDLDPPISVQHGDFLAVTNLAPPDCGGPASVAAAPGEASASILSDFSGGTISNVRYGSIPAVRASTAPQALVGIIPAVGATAGAQGSQFRTLFQITNASFVPESTATFVFHPAGRSASPDDPRITVPLAAMATSSTIDLLTKMNVTGLGSIDVFTTGEPAPEVTAHVFNDTGSGTNGFIEPLMTPEEAAHFPADYFVPIPLDLTNYRANVGIRTLGAATINVAEFDAAGNAVIGSSQQKAYPADYFEQVPLASFLSPTAVNPGGVIWLQVSGSAMIYTTITDNRTNDSAITFVKANPE